MSAWENIVNKAFPNNQGIRHGHPNVMIYAGNPSATVDGEKTGTLCWDSTSGDAYICTDGSTAWTKINT